MHYLVCDGAIMAENKVLIFQFICFPPKHHVTCTELQPFSSLTLL